MGVGAAAARKLAAEVLSRGGSGTAAAEAAGRSPRTVKRWCAEAVFEAEVEALAELQRSALAGRLDLIRSSALDAILGALRDPDARTRVRAAAVVLRSLERP